MDKIHYLRDAEKEFNSKEYPFTAEAHGNQIVFSWKWKDAVLAGTGNISKEMSEFRYIVTLCDNGTFHGFDMTETRIARAENTGLSFAVSGQIGHTWQYRKEVTLGADKDGIGIKTFSFSTDEIKKPVRQFFEARGWVYREPPVQWCEATGIHRAIFAIIGAIFSLAGGIVTAIFARTGFGAWTLIPAAFLLIGICGILLAVRMKKIPVFSTALTLATVFGGFAGAWAIVLLGIALFVPAGMTAKTIMFTGELVLFVVAIGIAAVYRKHQGK